MCSKKYDGDFVSPSKSRSGGELSVSDVDPFRLRSVASSDASTSRWVRRGRKLLFVSSVLTGAVAIGQMPSAAAEECTDTDGDGFGWDGTNTCDVDENPATDETEQPKSATVEAEAEPAVVEAEPAVVEAEPAVVVEAEQAEAQEKPVEQLNLCVDTDGDGFGWDGVDTCIAPTTTAKIGQVDQTKPVDVDIDAKISLEVSAPTAPEKASEISAPVVNALASSAPVVAAPVEANIESPALVETALVETAAASADSEVSVETVLAELATEPVPEVALVDTNSASVDLAVSPQAEPAVVQPVTPCVDVDGDGFGWNGVTTCLPSVRPGTNFATVSNGYLNPGGSSVNAVGTLRPSDGRQTVNVTWDPIAGASGYNVFRDGHYIGSANGGSLTLTDVLPAGASGNYSIRAFDQFGTYGDIGSSVSSSFSSGEEQIPVGQQPPTEPIVGTPPDGTDPVDSLLGDVDQPAAPLLCVDTDGDGFGWDGFATCIPDSTTVIDPGVELPVGDPIVDGPCSQQLLVVGDSWAHYSYPTLNDVFTEQGWCVHRDSPDGQINFAEIGAVSHQFQPGETLNTGVVQRLDEICLSNCDDVSILFSIGGNDHLEFPTDEAGQVQAAGELGQRIATSIGSFAQVAPNAEIVLPGYDILNVDNSALCRALPAFVTGDPDAPLGVTAAVPRSMATINDNLVAALPNTQHADLIGTLQGDPGNRDITTLPARFLTREDCIHATDEGHKIFAEEVAMVIDPTLSLPGATAIDVNAPDPRTPDPIGPNERPGIGIQPTTDIPANPATYDSLTIDYQVLNNIEMDDQNLEILGVSVSDDEIELKVIEFGITPGKPETAYTRVLPRQGQISADEGDIKNIPDYTGLYGFSDLNPIGFKEFREDKILPDLIGHVVIAYENDDGGLGDSLEDDVVQRAADQLETELINVVGPISEPLDIAVAPQLIIDQVFEGTDRVNDAAEPQDWLAERLAEGFGQLVDTNVIFYFVTDPETSDKLNPAFNQFRQIDTPALGGAATNQSFVLDFRRGAENPDPHYEVVVDVRLGTGLATSADRPPPPENDSDGSDELLVVDIPAPAPAPISTPIASGLSDGSPSSADAQEAADEYADGDIAGGEFGGTPTTLDAPSPVAAPAPVRAPSPPKPAEHKSMADEKAEQAERTGEADRDAQDAADEYAGGNRVGGEYG